MRSVFDGGEGVINGGRADKSSESSVWVPFVTEVAIGLEDGEVGGEAA